MFQSTSFNYPLDTWNVESAWSFLAMFSNTPFNQDISNWNLSSGTQFIGMFSGASEFRQSLCRWGDYYDSSHTYSNMFGGSGCLNQGDPTSAVGPWCGEDCSHLIVCGSSYAACSGNSVAADNRELHEVRCCSGTYVGTGWVKDQTCTQAGFDVWGGSKINGTCYGDGWSGGAQDYYSAKAICESVAEGVRLCTSAELLADCTKGSGCDHNYDMIWSSTSAAPQAMVCLIDGMLDIDFCFSYLTSTCSFIFTANE